MTRIFAPLNIFSVTITDVTPSFTGQEHPPCLLAFFLYHFSILFRYCSTVIARAVSASALPTFGTEYNYDAILRHTQGLTTGVPRISFRGINLTQIIYLSG